MEQVRMIGIDLSKRSLQLHGARASGLVLPQNANNLLFREPFPLHRAFSRLQSQQETSHSEWPGSGGEGRSVVAVVRVQEARFQAYHFVRKEF